MDVFVIGLNGNPLMPMKPQKARKLLNTGKAVVFQKRPFTIQLLYKTGTTVQPITIGVDTGSQHIGIAVVANNKVLYKTDIALRDTMEKRTLLETRKAYRRNRRYRKVRYRKPKYKFRTKRTYSDELVKRKSTKHMTHWVKHDNHINTNRHEGWLPPSIESKLQQHYNWINRFMNALPNAQLVIELARFDVAHMKDPAIHNELYQRGPQYEYENVKAFVFDRDGYKCKLCGAKGCHKHKDGTAVKLVVHHILMRSKGATDNPEYLVTLCDACHDGISHKTGALYDMSCKFKPFKRGYRDTAFMNILQKRLRQTYSFAKFTYGNITNADRKRLMLSKSHANDAVAIASIDLEHVKNINETMYYVQVRKKKRSLHEATARKGRSEPNRTSKRNAKNTKSSNGYYLYDKICFNDKVGWITGFTGQACYAKDFNGNYIVIPNKNHKQLNLSQIQYIKHNNNWICYSEQDALRFSSRH